MDAAIEAYIRDLSLYKWRELEGMMDLPGATLPKVFAQCADFGQFKPYQAIWEKHWQAQLGDLIEGNSAAAKWEMGGDLFLIMEKAIHDALLEEMQARNDARDDTIEDTPLYLEFVARAMGQLYNEAGEGDVEEIEEE